MIFFIFSDILVGWANGKGGASFSNPGPQFDVSITNRFNRLQERPKIRFFRIPGIAFSLASPMTDNGCGVGLWNTGWPELGYDGVSDPVECLAVFIEVYSTKEFCEIFWDLMSIFSEIRFHIFE